MIKLKQIIENVLIYEGLHITHPIGTSIEILQNWGIWKNNSNISFETLNDSKILVKVITISIEEFDKILLLSNNLGYFPSFIEGGDNKNQKYNYNKVVDYINNNISFKLKLEAKYDLEVTGSKNIPHVLYHITDLKYKDKILKLGLIPKSKSKIANHPSRIYLMFSPNDMGILLKNPKSGIKNPCMFEIDIHKTHNKIRIFNDPNFSNKGIYTYDNIAPQYLKLIFPV